MTALLSSALWWACGVTGVLSLVLGYLAGQADARAERRRPRG